MRVSRTAERKAVVRIDPVVLDEVARRLSVGSYPSRPRRGVLRDAATKVLSASITWGKKIVDFDDQLYLPTLTDGIAFPTSYWNLVDEFQDLSGLQLEMVLRMSARGRLLGVGDPNQAIYGWRGAGVDAMATSARRLGARALPLSICYRCPSSIVALASEIVPAIEPAPGAPEGEVSYLDKAKLSDFPEGDLVLCRNRAPLLRLAYRLLSAKRPVKIRGGTAEAAIVAAIRDSKATTLEELVEKVEAATSRAIARATARHDEAAATAAMDRRDAIVAIVEGTDATTPAELAGEVERLCGGPDEGKVLLSTVHSAKGLEADGVWFLDPELIPSRAAKLDWQRRQERNLRYVAITRAKKYLRHVRSNTIA